MKTPDAGIDIKEGNLFLRALNSALIRFRVLQLLRNNSTISFVLIHGDGRIREIFCVCLCLLMCCRKAIENEIDWKFFIITSFLQSHFFSIAAAAIRLNYIRFLMFSFRHVLDSIKSRAPISLYLSIMTFHLSASVNLKKKKSSSH
jgi:hypothetical protein